MPYSFSAMSRPASRDSRYCWSTISSIPAGRSPVRLPNYAEARSKISGYARCSTSRSGVRSRLIRARSGEGRASAKARRVKLGRQPKLTLHRKCKAISRRDELGEPVRDIARSYNVRYSTISRLVAD